MSEISDIACRIGTSGSGSSPPGSGSAAWKLSCNPFEVSFAHSKHTSATDVGHCTPTAATDNGTSCSPADPPVRDCQNSWAPDCTDSSPFVTPHPFPRPLRSSASRCPARMASASGSGSRPSITNAFATAIRPSDVGSRGLPGYAHDKASAASDRRQSSGPNG